MLSHLMSQKVSHSERGTERSYIPIDEMGRGKGAASHTTSLYGMGDVMADGAFAICAGNMDCSPALWDWIAKLESAEKGSRRVHQMGTVIVGGNDQGSSSSNDSQWSWKGRGKAKTELTCLAFSPRE
jgi:hypothetical protein